MKETYESQKTPTYTPVYGSPSYRTQLYEKDTYKKDSYDSSNLRFHYLS